MKKNNENMPEIIIENYRKDNHGHNYCVAKCSYCCNFFVTRKDSIVNGHTKSCGCLSHRRKRNTYYFPIGCDFVIGYYDNFDGFFIFDFDKFEVVSKYYWSCRDTKKRIEPISHINGKTTSMARFLMNTPDGFECDHINRNPSDNRVANLRNCTHMENVQNRRTEKDDELEYGDFSYKKSQEIAKSIETNQFNNLYCYGGTIEKINRLPEKNIYKVILRNLCRKMCNGELSEGNGDGLLLQLIGDYNLYEKKHDSCLMM